MNDPHPDDGAAPVAAEPFKALLLGGDDGLWRWIRDDMEAAGFEARWYAQRSGVGGVVATLRPDVLLLAPAEVDEAIEIALAALAERTVPCLLLTGPPLDPEVAGHLVTHGISTLPAGEDEAGVPEILATLRSWLAPSGRRPGPRHGVLLASAVSTWNGRLVAGGPSTAELSLPPLGLPRGIGTLQVLVRGEAPLNAPVEVICAEAGPGHGDGPELRVLVRVMDPVGGWDEVVCGAGAEGAAPALDGAADLGLGAVRLQVAAIVRGDESGGVLLGPLSPIRVRECLAAAPYPLSEALAATGAHGAAPRSALGDIVDMTLLWLRVDQAVQRAAAEGVGATSDEVGALLGAAQRSFRELVGRRERARDDAEEDQALFVDVRNLFLGAALDLRHRWSQVEPERASRVLAPLKAVSDYAPGALIRVEVEALRRLLASRRPPTLETATLQHDPEPLIRSERILEVAHRGVDVLSSRRLAAALGTATGLVAALALVLALAHRPPGSVPAGALPSLSTGLVAALRSDGGEGPVLLGTINPVYWTMLRHSEREAEADALWKRLRDQGVTSAFLYDPEGHLLATFDAAHVVLVRRYASSDRD